MCHRGKTIIFAQNTHHDFQYIQLRSLEGELEPGEVGSVLQMAQYLRMIVKERTESRWM